MFNMLANTQICSPAKASLITSFTLFLMQKNSIQELRPEASNALFCWFQNLQKTQCEREFTYNSKFQKHKIYI